MAGSADFIEYADHPALFKMFFKFNDTVQEIIFYLAGDRLVTGTDKLAAMLKHQFHFQEIIFGFNLFFTIKVAEFWLHNNLFLPNYMR
jgi:hypothetical protein